jgi:hypothetical protein
VPIADGPRVPAGYMSETAALFNGSYVDDLEVVPDLTWPQNVITYNNMRRDPQIGAILNAYALPLRSGTWMVDPAGARDEVVQYVADTWGLPILGDSEATLTPYRKRGVQFKQHLRLALLQLVFGHMPFAFAGEPKAVDGGRLRWRLNRLDERLPQTITSVNVNEKGDLLSIRQFGGQTDIPASNLLWYVHDREGSNWTGTSMLRSCYGAWLLKHDMWRVLATSSRRFGMGVPTVYAPTGATEAEITNAARLASSIRAGDQSGQGLPDGYRMELVGLTGQVPDTMKFVRYLDQQMAQAALASILTLDATPNGSRALGDVIIGMLRMSWEAVADEIAIPATELTARMIDWNWGEDEPVPMLMCTDLDHQERTYEAISALVKTGAITPDPGLENAMRESYQLPPYRGPEPSRYLPDDPNRPPEPPPPDPGAAPVPNQAPPPPPSAPASSGSAGARIPGVIHARSR